MYVFKIQWSLTYAHSFLCIFFTYACYFRGLGQGYRNTNNYFSFMWAAVKKCLPLICITDNFQNYTVFVHLMKNVIVMKLEMLLHRTVKLKQAPCHAGKNLCCNANGLEKFLLLVIGRWNKSCCYSMKKLSCEYTSNKVAWIKSHIFLDFFHKFDRKMEKKINGKFFYSLISILRSNLNRSDIHGFWVSGSLTRFFNI